MSDKLPQDEISLIDLVVVLLRYRRLIFGCTLLAVLISVATIAFLPGYRYKQSLATPTYETVLVFRISPVVYKFMGNQDEVDEYIRLAVNDPSVILASLRDAGITKIGAVNVHESDEDNLLFTIRKTLAESNTIFSVQGENGKFRASVRIEDTNDAKFFLCSIINHANFRMADLLLPFARMEINTYEKVSSIEYPRTVIEEDLITTFKRYASALGVASGEDPSLVVLQDPYSIQNYFNTGSFRKSLVKRSLVVVFGIFFLTIICSFILDWIYRVRHDPEAMVKIQDALRKHGK